MLNFKGMRFPMDVILVCIRWYAAYPLSYRHLEEIMEERSMSAAHSSINQWTIRFLPLIETMARSTSARLAVACAWMRTTSKSRASGNTSTAPSTSSARPSTSC